METLIQEDYMFHFARDVDTSTFISSYHDVLRSSIFASSIHCTGGSENRFPNSNRMFFLDSALQGRSSFSLVRSECWCAMAVQDQRRPNLARNREQRHTISLLNLYVLVWNRNEEV